MTNDTTLQKLDAILTEMQSPSFYYAQPQSDQQVNCVLAGKQQEWISRLLMIREDLKREVIIDV